MVESAADVVEARLRAFLSGELRRAEIDYPQIPLVASAGSRSRRPLVLAAVVVCVVAAVVLVRPWVGPPATSTGGVPSASVAATSVVVTASPTEQACRSALAEGYLEAEGGALVLQGTTDDKVPMAWPVGWSVRSDGDTFALIDPSGVVKARPGDYLHVGGGVGNDGLFHGCGDITVVPLSVAEPPARGTVIDGFTIGVMEACSSPIGSPDPSLAGSSCSGQPALALAALDARDPGHATVISTARFSDGTQPEPVDVTGNAPTPTPPPTAHPGPLVTVFVFILADGSVRATGVACPDARSCVGVGTYPD
jgi:hypothetical protein